MKQGWVRAVIWMLVMGAVAGEAHAAEAQKGFDKYGRPLPSSSPAAFDPSTAPVKATGGPAPVAEGNSLQTSVKVDPPPRRLCSDYSESDPDIVAPIRNGCPAGYICNGQSGTNRNLFNCKKVISPGQALYADDFYCRWRSCVDPNY